MKKTRSLVRLIIGSAILMAAVLFNFSVSAEPKLSEPIVTESSVSMIDLDMKIESSLDKKIKYHYFYSVEYNDLVFNDIDLSNLNDSKLFNLYSLNKPTFNKISELYKTDILSFYQDPNIRISKNYDVLKVAVRSYSF